MYSGSEQYYDFINANFRDFPAEAAHIAGVIRQAHPTAQRVLDVACGTAEHARLLRQKHGYAVDGIDLNPAFVRIAQEKLPGSHVAQADMTSFVLARKYDVVLCMFASLAYVRTLANVRKALGCFRVHLEQEGVILVEPWFPPGGLLPNQIVLRSAESEGLTVCRMSQITVEERISHSQFHYLIGRPSGIEHIKEVHELGLFTVDEMLECFRAAGLLAIFDPVGPYGRGLFVARLLP